MENKKELKSLRGQAAIEKAPLSARTLHGQAAMEYLMTYGWAILVIVVVLAVLAFLLSGVSNVPQTCVFDKSEFNCQERPPALVVNAAGNVDLYFKLYNNDNKAIEITRVICTTAAKGDVQSSWGTATVPAGANGFRVGPGSSTPDPNASPIPTGWRASFPCTDKTGTGALTMSSGAEFRGNLVVFYKYSDDLSPTPRRSTAIVTGKVQ